MALTIKDAVELIDSGQARDRVERFVGAIHAGALSGQPVSHNFDDALVASMVLSLLLDTPEGRKLMGDSKRPNLQYQAASYAAGSPERLVARRFLLRETERRQALTELEDIFRGKAGSKDGDVDVRTLKRLFDDLVAEERRHHDRTKEMLIAAGWDGQTEDSLDAARGALLKRLG